ncbi:MAG: UbiA prenyltransferase family protein [Thermoplasmata archaeon]|nr:MAG: UbiA prenyltransferase family protein [Thermoplasmata archaeon]
MVALKNIVKEYLKLIRLHHAGLTSVAPIFGALILGFSEPWLLLVLFTVGFAFHIFGFVLNDCMDWKCDALSCELAERPLVKGSISLSMGYVTAASAIILAGLLCLVFLNFLAFSVLMLAGVLGLIYDVYGKKLAGSDVILAGSISCLVLTGAYAVSPRPWFGAYLVAALGGVQVLGMNVIYGGLKDARHDHLSGARSTALRTGMRIDDHDRIRMPWGFLALSYGIQLVHIGCAFAVLLLVTQKNLLWFVGGFTLLSFVLLYSLSGLLALRVYDRAEVRKWVAYYVGASHLLAVFVMLPVMPIILAFLAIHPLAWFSLSNMALYRTVLNPHTQ